MPQRPVRSIVPTEIIQSNIYMIRGKKIMFDRDLARLYKVETGHLNQAISRNISRFPPDFMFQLTSQEFSNLISQFGISSWGGIRKSPHVFTEHGILMLSSVLNSERAVQVNIQIMREFIRMRELMVSNDLLKRRIENLEKKYRKHDEQFSAVFETIKKLIEPPRIRRKKFIGFHA